MSLNKDLIETKIREMNDSIQILKEIVSREFEGLSLYERLSARYLLIQLVEAASSICIHILSSLFKERPEGYPECFIRLSLKEVISKDLASKLASASRLRNLLVHRYWVIDDRKVYDAVREGLKNFEEFISQVEEFLGENGGGR